MIWTRRRFLRVATGMIGCGAWTPSGLLRAAQPDGARQLQADAVTNIPIVDTHQHLWDLTKLRLPWLGGDARLARNHLLDDYLKAVEGLPVVKAVYMEVAVADEDLVKEAEWIIDLCNSGRGPTVAAVIGGRPASEGFRRYFSQFRENRVIKGIRWIPPATSEGHKLYFSPEMKNNLQLLGEWGMRFDLCIPPDWLSEAAELVDACPQTRFILDHCGNADPQQFGRWGRKRGREAAEYVDRWQRGIDALAARKNVVCKISGIVARVNPDDWQPEDLAPIVHYCLQAFGPDQVMFAGDWPVCTKGAPLRDWILALHTIVADRPFEERRKLFHDNAVQFYAL